ncbi:hypothetical protein SBA4_4580042 [Candidatus Sulfopaludibacter sp. SbA4]|nr:hypothetical protein SBA4_4580042 [Candidatus Sulfopaludibacter sp. SbA4]
MFFESVSLPGVGQDFILQPAFSRLSERAHSVDPEAMFFESVTPGLSQFSVAVFSMRSTTSMSIGAFRGSSFKPYF